MAAFAMCSACGQEYGDPGDRRFHAQPNCCPACGPQLRLLAAHGQSQADGDGAVRRAVSLLAAGRIVAVKGLGGFHLAVDAGNDQAVARLRQRKGREAKPLAVLVADLDRARALCLLGEEEEAALLGWERPIVLARKRPDHGLSPRVAPGSDSFGIMLPCTPLQYLLLAAAPYAALVMTSANISEEPICIDDAEALDRLTGIADFFLCHDRRIARHCDDSVLIGMAGEMRPLRRARGYAPQPLLLGGEGPPVLGVGAELKNTVCLLKGAHALLSPHIGDLKNAGTWNVFRDTIGHLAALFAVQPELLIHDLHPGYLSSRWAAEENETPCLAVQHHHAHLAACLAENRFSGPAIGIILDGTGLGTDNTIWGGEVLLGDAAGCSRFAALESLPLPGGDAAVREPWRTAAGYLFAACGADLPALPFLAGHDWKMIGTMVEKKLNSPLTSSCGRLFDAVAAMAGGRQVITCEAQAAVELMQDAGGRIGSAAFPCEIFRENGMLRVSVRSLVRAVAEAVLAGMERQEISRRFHRTLVEVFCSLARAAREQKRINEVVLSGGVFQNRLLFEEMTAALAASGFRVLAHREIPCNDACISLGQAVIGRRLLRKE
jgi:hydrogenase maturation protein HypF